MLTREMGQAFPELIRAEALITETLKLEETRFRATLERGLAILDEKSAGLKKGAMFDGETAFTLYDTYGFPLDLTQDALRARGIGVDLASFNDAMERQRAKARASWAGSGEAAHGNGLVRPAREGRRHRIPRLRDRERRRRGRRAGQGRQGSHRAEKGRERRGGDEPDAVLRRDRAARSATPARCGARACGSPSPTRRRRPAICSSHLVKVEEGTVKVGDPLLLEVDHARRAAIRQNHSATHLLHEALRQVLGDHVAQKGSLVAPDRLRFDFSHPKPMTAAELERVEDIANDIVLQNAPVTTRLMALDDARASGARALFGEKYGDEVRVVAMGEGVRQHARLVDRAVRRHARQAHRRYRLDQRRSPIQASPPACAASRRSTGKVGAQVRRASGADRQGRGGRTQGAARGNAGAHRLAARRAQEARARADRGEEETRHGRRRAALPAAPTACARSTA